MHFEAILKNNGFELSSEGTPQKLDKDEQQHQSELVEDMLSKLFDQFVASERKQYQQLKHMFKQVQHLKRPMDEQPYR